MTTLTDSFLTELDHEYAQKPYHWAVAPVARALADHVVCAAAGWTALGHEWVGTEDGLAHVLGLSLTRPPAVAAAANAASAHALDRDDLHWPSLSHPGGVVWPVVLALGEEFDAGGALAVRAAALGYEVTARLAVALGAGHRQFWHATTTAGTVGAAVAGALVSGADKATAVAAASHAASVTGGSIQTLLERSGTRLFHRSHAVRTAIAAALAARSGLPATKEVLEAPKGLFAAVAPGRDPYELLVRPEGGWAIERLTMRMYASSGFTHTAIDAALGLGPLDPRGVEGIRIAASPACADLAANPRPLDREAAWWSVQYAVAVSLLSGDPAALETKELNRSPELWALLEKTEVSRDDTADVLSATVEVRQRSDVRAASCTVPYGHPDRPADIRGLARKWAAMLPLPDVDIEEIWRVANAAEGCPFLQTVRKLGLLVQPKTPRGTDFVSP